MSLGPQNRERDVVETKIFDKVRFAFKKTTSKYFERPTYYLFYTCLTGTAVSLFAGRGLRIEFWGLLFLLGIAEHYKTLLILINRNWQMIC